ncbi:MAG: leucine-rich repeat protein [Mycoplasmataceae bacterium]|nr:leucine-rich repeat protein [Mycoplasmataceae bacterium]
MKNNILLWLSTIIPVGAMCGFTLSLMSAIDLQNVHKINTINEQMTSLNSRKATSETILTLTIVKELGWDIKPSITLDDWNQAAPNITSIDNLAFYQNTILTFIDIPSSITSIGTSCFGYNIALKTVRFEENSNVWKISAGIFDFSGIDSIIIPSSVISIENAAFSNTKFLKTVTFQENSNIDLIASNAFKNSSIKSIILPNKDLSIGPTCFENTISLTNIVAKYDVKQNSTIAKYGFTQNQWDNIKWIYSPTESLIITLDVLNSLGWDKKSTITFNDWYIMAPNAVTIESGFINHNILERIEIPKTITFIDGNSFSGNTKLLSIKMLIALKKSEKSYGLTDSQWNNIDWFNPGTVLLGGSFEVLKVTEILPFNFSESQIKQIIISNLIRYAPTNLIEPNIILENLMTNNLKGEISFSASINKYFDDDLIEQTSGFTPISITFVGFKKIIPNLIIEKEYLVENM